MAKKPKAPTAAGSGGGGPLFSVTGEGGLPFGQGECPIEPTDGDREIGGGVSDAQLGGAVRQLTAQGRVVVLWTCDHRLWLRSIRVDPGNVLTFDQEPGGG